MARFAERMSVDGHTMNRQRAYHLLGEARHKNIGDELARRIEVVFNKPVDWLDTYHQKGASSKATDDVTIGSMDVGAALGGRMPLLGRTMVKQMSVARDWMTQNLGQASGHLELVTITGDAMAPSLPSGTQVLVDRGASAIAEGGVYMLGNKKSAAGDVVFRHVHRAADGKYHLVAENKRYEKQILTDLRRAGYIVLGKVVVALELKRV